MNTKYSIAYSSFILISNNLNKCDQVDNAEAQKYSYQNDTIMQK